MTNLVEAEGPILDRILNDTHQIWHDGLSRQAYDRFYAAQVAMPWGSTHLRRLALVDGDRVLASAKLYRFEAMLDRRSIQVTGIGAVFTAPDSRGRGAARELMERLLERAAAGGADMALLFSEIGPDYYARLGFEVIPRNELRLRVTESTRHGAPMTMVRDGGDRDLRDIVAIGAVRAEPFRFHLMRDRDLVHFAIAKKRLLAGLAPSGVRAVDFVVAEEGGTVAAYVVISVRGGEWTIEEAGDRDSGGARLGAILQALIAREPAEQRPSIKAWLPEGFLPPQIAVVSEQPAKDVMMMRALTPRGQPTSPLTRGDVCYWNGDLF